MRKLPVANQNPKTARIQKRPMAGEISLTTPATPKVSSDPPTISQKGKGRQTASYRYRRRPPVIAFPRQGGARVLPGSRLLVHLTRQGGVVHTFLLPLMRSL